MHTLSTFVIKKSEQVSIESCPGDNRCYGTEHDTDIAIRCSMRDRAENDAVRWCHLTHQIIAGASVHSRGHKTSLVRCTDIFFEET